MCFRHYCFYFVFLSKQKNRNKAKIKNNNRNIFIDINNQAYNTKAIQIMKYINHLKSAKYKEIKEKPINNN